MNESKQLASDKVFSFDDFTDALYHQDSMADLEPYEQLITALAKYLKVDLEQTSIKHG